MKAKLLILIMLFAVAVNGQNVVGNYVRTHTTFRQDSTYTPTGNELKGYQYFDKENRTISVPLGNGVIMQIGQESLIQVHNGSGDTIMDGRILGAIGGAEDRVSVAYANKSERYDALIMSTEIIPADSIGLAVEIAGRVNGVNTGSVPIGPIYLDTLGLITDNQGEFPDYNYQLGAVVKTGVTDGIIQFRSDGTDFRNDISSAFDGAIRETFDFRTFSNGTTVYGVLTNSAGDSTLTLMFSDGWYDFSVPDTITLTAGTSTVPQLSYVFIDKDTRTLQSSTSMNPSTVEYAQVAKIALLDAATTQTDGALINQNINNHLKYTQNNGHIVHMGDRIRVLNAQWESGVALTVSGTPTNLYLATTSGMVWQIHLQSFAAQDMSSGDDVHIVNHFTTPYNTTTNLNTVTTYSDGTTWNNEWTNLVIWGVANKTGETSHIMINLSSDGYLTEEKAIEDANNYASYTIPRAFRGVGFLIARITVRRSPAGYTYNPSIGYLDLRGYYPNNTAGGGTGSSGLTEFTQLDDTPSSYIGFGDSALFVTSAEDGVEFRQIQQSDVKDLVGDISALQAESHPAVTLAGTPDYITINPTTQEITRNQIDLTSDVTGALPDGNVSDDITASNYLPLIGDTMQGDINMISYDLEFQGSDPGDLIWRDELGVETNRLWMGVETLNYRSNKGTTYQMLHTGNIESEVLSTWPGSINLTTLGTITSGIWNGSIIGDSYITKTGNWTGTFDGQEGSYYLNYNNLTNKPTSSLSSNYIPRWNGSAFVNSNIVNSGGYTQITNTDTRATDLNVFGDNKILFGTTVGAGVLNAPSGVGFGSFIHHGGYITGIASLQILAPFDDNTMYFRTGDTDPSPTEVWNSWEELWHSGNAGNTSTSWAVAADPYDATWNGLQEAAPKDAVYDKIESLSLSTPWNTDANGINYQAGNVGIGTTSSSTYDLYVAGTSWFNSKVNMNDGLTIFSGGLDLNAGTLEGVRYHLFDAVSVPVSFSGANGMIVVSSSDELPYYLEYNGGSVNTYSFDLTTTSDFWKKKDFRPIHNALDKVLSLNTYAFNWKEDFTEIAPTDEIKIVVNDDNESRDATGVIAQEIQDIMPEVVKTMPNTGYKAVDYKAIVPYLIEAIKEQQKQIDALKHEIELLK